MVSQTTKMSTGSLELPLAAFVTTLCALPGSLVWFAIVSLSSRLTSCYPPDLPLVILQTYLFLSSRLTSSYLPDLPLLILQTYLFSSSRLTSPYPPDLPLLIVQTYLFLSSRLTEGRNDSVCKWQSGRLSLVPLAHALCLWSTLSQPHSLSLFHSGSLGSLYLWLSGSLLPATPSLGSVV